MRIGAVVEPAKQLDGSVEGVEVAIAVIADVHPAAALGAVPIQHVKFPGREVGIRGPLMRHDAQLRDT
jgi:hypothetical protein